LVIVKLPQLEEKSWECAAAYSVHGALYLLLLLTPLAGWLMASSAGFQAPLYGLFKFPQLIAKSRVVHEIFEEVHSTLAWAILILASVHVLAALKHHVFEKDDTLRRMLRASRA
jgi:cytochrome b561